MHGETPIGGMLNPQRVSKDEVLAENNLYVRAKLVLQIRSVALEDSSNVVGNFRIIRLGGEQYILQAVDTKILVGREGENVFLKIAQKIKELDARRSRWQTLAGRLRRREMLT